MPKFRVIASSALLLLILAHALRLHFAGVVDQMLLDDELHALPVAENKSYFEILQYYGPSDNSIPLTLYAKALMQTVGLTELRLRAPVMLADVLMLLAPLLLVRRLGRTVAFASIALLSTSPLVVQYAVIARPYTPPALLLLVSLVCWDRWLRTESRWAMGWFAVSGAGAVFWHLLCVFPLLALLIPTWLEVRAGRFPRAELSKAVVAIVGVGLLLLGPGIPGILESRLDKVGQARDMVEVIGTSYTSFHGYVAATEWAFPPLFALGAWRLYRRAPRLGIAATLMVLTHFAGVSLIRPLGSAAVLARYWYMVWPVAAVVVAAGIEAVMIGVVGVATRDRDPDVAVGRAEVPAVAAAVLLALVVPWTSPSNLFRSGPNSFRASKAITHRYRTAEETKVSRIMATVRAGTSEGDTVLLCGAATEMHRYMKQGLLDRNVKQVVAYAEERRDAGIFLRNELSLRDPDEMRATGARYVIAHRAGCKQRARALLRKHFGEPILYDPKTVLFEISPE